MKKKLRAFMVVLIPMFVLLLIIHPVKAIYIHSYKYLDDDASWDADTFEIHGGDAEVRYGDMSDLGMYAHTTNAFDEARATQYINGGYLDNSPWIFYSTRTYNLRVYWLFSGNYEEDGIGYFKFEYDLYRMVGETHDSVKEWTIEYTASFDYEDELVYHNAGTVSLSTGITYYLMCTITLYHADWWDPCTSDMYNGADELNFQYADFYYWSPKYEP